MVKNPPAMQETPVWFLGWEDPLEKGTATHSSIDAWRIPMDRGAWWAIIPGVAKSWTWLTEYSTAPLWTRSMYCYCEKYRPPSTTVLRNQFQEITIGTCVTQSSLWPKSFLTEFQKHFTVFRCNIHSRLCLLFCLVLFFLPVRWWWNECLFQCQTQCHSPLLFSCSVVSDSLRPHGL